MILQGEFLVINNNDRSIGEEKTVVVSEEKSKIPTKRILLSNVSLSFWGGIDPVTGIIIDESHPLVGEDVSDTILCLPSGRGSCTASQVLLELILNKKAPRAIVMRDVDGLLCVGAIVAQEVFSGSTVPDIVHIGTNNYQKLLAAAPKHGRFQQQSGCLIIGGDNDDIDINMVTTTKNSDEEESSSVTAMTSSISVQRSFTQEEQQLLEDCTTEAERIALKVIFRYAEITSESPAYLDTSQAHIDGCTYIGPGGLKFVERLVEAEGKVRVPTTLNSVSTDRRRHKELGVPLDYATAAVALGDAYLALGCQLSFTCAPYLLPGAPKVGDNIAWGESNAVVYANSVLGARTEKYADYLDICCAITGKIPAVGVHLEQNRIPEIVLDASELLLKLLPTTAAGQMSNNDIQVLFPTLGHLCGSLSDGKVPVLVGFDTEEWSQIITNDHLKMFCAAYGTTGTSPLIHIAGITPEMKDPHMIREIIYNCKQQDNHCSVNISQLEETFHALDGGTNNEVNLIAIGNPHLSVSDCSNLIELIKNISKEENEKRNKNRIIMKEEDNLLQPKKHEDIRIIACMSRALQSKAQEEGYVDFLSKFGIEFINDTCWCMLLDPPVIPTDPKGIILTNSGKYAHYGPGLTNREFRFGSTADCVRAAFTGKYAKKDISSALGLTRHRKGVGFPNANAAAFSTLHMSRSFTTTVSKRNNIDEPLLFQFRAYNTAINANRVISSKCAKKPAIFASTLKRGAIYFLQKIR